nr:transcription factor IIIB 50 kDa subunit [Pelodiscus sinensis]|eukprot:XP_006134119.1 transcription factor IIIB 50 kDa subunit [Pelodiscus sinensis]
MSGPRKCPDCGSSDIVDDAHYAQNQLVCADCGFVLTEGLLTTTFQDEEHLQEVTYSRSTGQNEQLSRCTQRGIKRVQDLCKVLRLPAVFEDTALSYFQRAIKHPSFHLVRLEKKEILVGCCVFVTCRQHNWPLTMGTICSLLYADKELFASVYLAVLKELELDVPALSLMDLVKTHLNSFKLFQSSASIPARFAEDKDKMVARTIQIVELASETWLVTGRHPIPIVLSRQGQDGCPDNPDCGAGQRDLAGDRPASHSHRPAHLRLKELNDILLRMASQLAWLRVLQVDKKTGSESSLRAAGCAGQAEGCPPGGKQKSSTGQRPLLPPCLLNPRKRLRTAAPSPAEQAITGDEAISDSEIEQYLRSQEEMREFRKAQAQARH